MTLFTTLGMFIIDEIHFSKDSGYDRPSVYDIVGGGGTFACLGARLVTPAPGSKEIKFIVDKGNDFPASAVAQLDSWDLSLVYRTDSNRKTTRGWNAYLANEERDFKYMTPKKRIEWFDIVDEGLGNSESFHLICSPNRCISIAQGFESKNCKGQIIWEPVPNECTKENLAACKEALQYVDIMSPNSKEAAAFWGLPEPLEKQGIEEVASKFAAFMKPGSVLVIRSGSLGCYVLTSEKSGKWYPAFHQGDQSKIIDPTGCGNSFLGAFSIGMVREKNIDIAAVYGNVASSIVIERFGMPILTRGENGQELWNDIDVKERCQEYTRKYLSSESTGNTTCI